MNAASTAMSRSGAGEGEGPGPHRPGTKQPSPASHPAQARVRGPQAARAATRAGRRRGRPGPSSPTGAARGRGRLPQPGRGAPPCRAGGGRRRPGGGSSAPSTAARPGAVRSSVGAPRLRGRGGCSRRHGCASPRETGAGAGRRPDGPGEREQAPGGPRRCRCRRGCPPPGRRRRPPPSRQGGDTPARSAPPGSRWPTWYWGKARSNRVTIRVGAAGGARPAWASSARTASTSSLVVEQLRAGRRRTARPRPGSARRRAGRGAATCARDRCTAVTSGRRRRRFARGTRKPVPVSGAGRRPPERPG